uniref:ZmpA/ZmpB/ZmpC family metallo-endopeptidase-related protein n=1 Tax=Alistipes sp. TaxID=1872444 RepID=UPI004056AF8C
MKRFSKIFAMIATMAAVVSCTTDVTEDFGVEVGGKTQLTLSLDNTRTQLGEKNGDTYPLTWSENDQISVNGVPSYELNKIDIDEDGTSATFSFGQSVKTPYFIAYPAAEADNQVVFPTVQNYNAEAAINNGVTVMYGYSADGKGIKLSHLSGLLKIGVKGTTSLKEVRISSVDRKPIAGTFNAEYNVEKETLALTPSETASSVITYSFGAGVALSATATNFYVAVPAGAYEELYITLENTAGNTMFKRIQAVKTENNDKTLKAGSVREFPVVEFTAIDANETFIISDYNSLETFAEAAAKGTSEASVTKNAVFVADVEIPETGWTTVDAQYYTGTINGNGYAIKGLNAPLFNNLGANVKGLHLEDVDITATASVKFGTLANAYYGSSISNCSTEGTVTINITKDAATFVGGFVGQTMKAATLSNLVNDVNITTSGEFKQLSLGGIVGSIGSSGNIVATTATNLTNKGDLIVKDTKFAGSRSTNNNFGGIVGYAYGTFTASDLTNEGAIHIVKTTKPTTAELGKINLGGILGLNGEIVTAENWHNKGTVLLQNIKLSCSYFNIGGIISYNGKANSTFTNLTNDGNITISNVELPDSSENCYMDVGGVTGIGDTTTYLKGNLTNTGDIVCYNVIKKGTLNPGVGGIVGLSSIGETNRINIEDAITLNNSGDIKIYGGSYAGSFGIAGIIGCNKSIGNIKNATNTGNIISATTLSSSKKAFVGGISGGNWEVKISDSKNYCNIAAFKWDGKANSTPTDAGSQKQVGMITSNDKYSAGDISNCQMGGGWFKSATVVTNEDGSLDLAVTYDAITPENFFQYMCGLNGPTSDPGVSVCKYWDGK